MMIKFAIVISIFLFPGVSTAFERVDYDLRLLAPTVDKFFETRDVFNKLTAIEVEGRIYTIKSSVGEKFIDFYLDSPQITLLSNQNWRYGL